MVLYKPNPVEVEPISTIYNWEIKKLEKDPITFHLVGTVGTDGRVSSSIVDFNLDEMLATTKSGRRYRLSAFTNGIGVNASYVLSAWEKINGKTKDSSLDELCETINAGKTEEWIIGT